MVILDVAIVNVALPRIKTNLGFSQANLQWVISAYAIMFGGVLLLGGRLGACSAADASSSGLLALLARAPCCADGLVGDLAHRVPRAPGPQEAPSWLRPRSHF